LVEASTRTAAGFLSDEVWDMGYQWGCRCPPIRYFAVGVTGQYIYIDPKNELSSSPRTPLTESSMFPD